jgi:hypothetical protein
MRDSNILPLATIAATFFLNDGKNRRDDPIDTTRPPEYNHENKITKSNGLALSQRYDVMYSIL